MDLKLSIIHHSSSILEGSPMSTQAQIEANRINAQKSTGPRTPEGKAIVAQNAIKHGLLARDAVVIGEETDDFAFFRDQLGAELTPVGLVESRLVARIAGLFWRLQRAERFHTEAFDMLYVQCAADPQTKRWQPIPGADPTDPAFSLAVVKDFSETGILERLLGYERRIENSLCRMMAELRKVQGQRQAAAVPGPRAAVRDTHPADLSRPEAYRPGRRSGRAREVPPLDFALDNLLAKIIAVQGQRAGVMANTPADASCQTKPISEEVSSEAVGAGPCACPSGGRPRGAAPTHIALQTFGGTPTGQGESCQTNPIEEEVSSVECEVSSEAGHATSVPAVSAAFCQTKPIGGLDERQVLDGQEVTKDAPQGETGKAEPEEAGYRLVHCVGRPAVRS
jgi:hypothetical protein